MKSFILGGSLSDTRNEFEESTAMTVTASERGHASKNGENPKRNTKSGVTKLNSEDVSSYELQVGSTC